MSDFYIRNEDGEEARGPFDIRKLASLAEAGQVTRATLIFNETKDEWIPVGADTELVAELFPERKKLKLRTAASGAKSKAQPPSLRKSEKGKAANRESAESASQNEDDDDDGEGSDIDAILADAEGESKETRHLKKKKREAEMAGSYLCPALAVMFLLSAAVFIIPNWDLVREGFAARRFLVFLNNPFLVVGLLDLLLALFAILAVTESFPFFRFRAAIGCGFLLYVGWALGDPQILLAGGLGMLGMFIALCTQRVWVMAIAYLFAFGGLGHLAFQAAGGRFSGVFDTIKFSFFST